MPATRSPERAASSKSQLPAGSRTSGTPPIDTTEPVTSTGRKFIPGEPMKLPTKRWDGRSNSSSGVPFWITSPWLITTTSSANVSASVWSWVTYTSVWFSS
jgi:hypothetical protein